MGLDQKTATRVIIAATIVGTSLAGAAFCTNSHHQQPSTKPDLLTLPDKLSAELASKSYTTQQWGAFNSDVARYLNHVEKFIQPDESGKIPASVQSHYPVSEKDRSAVEGGKHLLRLIITQNYLNLISGKNPFKPEFAMKVSNQQAMKAFARASEVAEGGDN